MQVEGDEANLHQLENRGELVGNVKLRDKGMLVVGDHAQVQLDNGEAQVDNNVKLNPATGFGTATNATLRVKDRHPRR